MEARLISNHISKRKSLLEKFSSDPAIQCCRITVLDGDHYQMDTGLFARQAISCLVKPEIGDQVCVLIDEQSGNFILSVLTRNELNRIDINVPGVRVISLKMPVIELIASKAMELCSYRDMNITTISGKLTIHAKNMMSCIQESMIEIAKNHFAHASHYGIKALELLHLNGRQHIISAEKDIRIDGEHINMG